MVRRGNVLREFYSHHNSIVHQLDARVKIVLALAIILSLNLTPDGAWPVFILFLTIILSLALISRLGFKLVLKRALLAMPFVVAAVPLIFTGPPPSILLNFAQGMQISYSPEGLQRFTSIAIKAWISIQAAIILAATTRFPDLLIALQLLNVPKLFVAIIGLMWRYLFVISEEATRMLRARSSRSSTSSGKHHTGGSLYWRARVTGGMAGSLLLRSIERSDRVYLAMVSRGYNGELPVSKKTALSVQNKRVLSFGILILACLWILGVFTGD